MLVPDHSPTGAHVPDTQRALVGRALARQDTLTFIDGRSPGSVGDSGTALPFAAHTTPVPSPSGSRASPVGGLRLGWIAPARTCSPDSSTPEYH